MNRLTRLFPVAAGLLGAVFIFACSDTLATSDQPEFGVGRVPPPATFLTSCRPQPRAVSSAWIGRKGGTLKASGHVFTVPEGALTARTLITMEAPSDTINRVVFGPEGLTFAPGHSPHLVMSYRNCWVRGKPELQIGYVDDALQILELTASASDTVGLTVDGSLKHFSEYVLLSTYAVAY